MNHDWVIAYNNATGQCQIMRYDRWIKAPSYIDNFTSKCFTTRKEARQYFEQYKSRTLQNK